MKRTILCVSFDETVAERRRAALEEAGCTAVSTTNVGDALQMLASVVFDAVLIGHRFAAADKHKLAAAAHSKNMPVVLVCGASAEQEIAADARVYALEGNSGLVLALNRVLAPKAVAEVA